MYVIILIIIKKKKIRNTLYLLNNTMSNIIIKLTYIRLKLIY